MDYGIIYIKIIPKSPKADWIQYCHLFKSLPDFLQLDFMSIISRINEKYQNEIIVPLFNNVHPGCITKPEDVKTIANDLYYKYDELMFELLDEHCIRGVYTIGEVDNPNKDISINQTYGAGLVKVGRYLDKFDSIGLYEI